MGKYVLVDDVNHVPQTGTQTYCGKFIKIGVPTWNRRLLPNNPKPMCPDCFEAITDVPFIVTSHGVKIISGLY